MVRCMITESNGCSKTNTRESHDDRSMNMAMGVKLWTKEIGKEE